ncbi:MAG: hypothetical protein HZC24_01515 [Rhodocyclales bacterium]|nr:hypothetical protein [Rhodocyclales bacterium]
MDEFRAEGKFVDKELYVYVLSTSGIMFASGGSSAELVGRYVSAILAATARARTDSCCRATIPVSPNISRSHVN